MTRPEGGLRGKQQSPSRAAVGFCFAFRAGRKLRCVDAMVGVCENKETA
jgi:hypothetical protein